MFKNVTLTLLLLFVSFSLFGQDFSSIWDTRQVNTESSTDTQIAIPTNPNYTYNYNVNWGDGNTDANVTGNITHTYTTPGRYTITIGGIFPSIYFNNTGDKDKIIEILSWGNILWQTMENAFYGCSNLNFDAIDSPDLSQVSSLRYMFRDAISFNGIINNWDISNITDISGIFYNAEVFNRPLDSWNTSSITDMSETFRGTIYNEPLDNWNTSSVTNMSSIFYRARNFNQNINSWNVSNVINMSNAFNDTSNFNTPLNNWNVSKVTDMSSMFDSSNFDQPINNWDVSNVTNMSGMFREAEFNKSIEDWDVSSVTDMSYLFQRNRYFNHPLNNWNVSNVTNMASMFDGFYWNNVFNFPLNNWDVSNVTDMSYMFRDTQNFNQDISGWDVSQVTNMQGMFSNTDVFNQNINAWNVSNVINMNEMFKDSQVYNEPLNNWDVSKVTNMSGMFSRALAFDRPLNNWITSAVTNMSSMFYGYNTTTVFNQDISNWDTSSVTNMNNTFAYANNFNQNISNWNIGNVTSMINIFSYSGLSQENYDTILMGWATQTVRSNVNLGAINLNYCDGRNARQQLIDDSNWTFDGDIINCSFVLCTSLVSPINGDVNVPSNANLIWEAVPGATGYSISARRVNNGVTQIIYDNEDVGNVVGIDFTTDLTPGDDVFVTIVPYNNIDGPAVGCTEESFSVIPSWVDSPDAFKLTFDTNITENWSSNNRQIEIEANDGYPGYYNYNYSIDWGDDQFDNNVTGDITHTYLSPGIYTVTIIGEYPSHFYSYFSDRIKLISIDQWGTQQWESMEDAFYYCENMVYNATDTPDLSNVSSMSGMFEGASLFNGDINNWNVSNVSDMSSLFIAADSFNQPLNNWNVSNVTDMSIMFLGADSFNQPIGSWNTGNVVNMSRMFEQTEIFNQPLNNWNVGNVTNMESMFERAEAFNQPLNNWNVSQVTNMAQMFDGFVTDMLFNQPLNNWDVSQVTNMLGMFRRAVDFDQPLNNWNVSAVENMSYMFQNTSNFNQPLDSWDVSAVTNMEYMFSGTSAFNQNIDVWNVTNVINMRSMFNNAILFNQPLNSWDVNSVVNMSSMFQQAQAFDQPLNNWNVSAVANMSSMFEGAILFNQPINNWDVSSVTLMPSMFEGASTFNQILNSWNVSSVTQMNAMFKEASAFNEPLNNWNTGEVLTMEEMFENASQFNQPINNWNVSFVTTMEEMFNDAIAFNQPLNSWNVASVETMKSMFRGASLFNQNIDSWNVRAVNTMEEMFYNASAFNETINSWRVSGVEDMDNMFRNATSFNQELDRWDIGTVSMNSMFENASQFNQELTEWNVSNVSGMRSMLDDTALSRENYDSTLISWSEQTLTTGITLGANGLLYCDALEERQSMIDTYGWTFNGDILDCPIPVCTQLISPLNGATDVPVNTNLVWDPALYARGYELTVRVEPGNTTIVNGEIISDTSYEFTSNFSGGETVYVTITPFNDDGRPTGCIEESFIINTNNTPSLPECTTLITPLNNSEDIAVNTDLSWNPIANADGYKINIGTITGGTDILNNEDVGNTTIYEFINDLDENTSYFVTIIPYNEEGETIGCNEEVFTTEFIPVPPSCTNLTSPFNGATNVATNTNLTWASVIDATGYLVIVGTTQGGIEIANNIDVGNATTYNFSEELLENRTYYVTIIPYNEIGDAITCTEENFRTGETPTIPECTTLSSPLNGANNIAVNTNITWNTVANTTGYKLTIGTTSGGTDILNNEDVGNITTYDLPTNLPEASRIYISIIPYNSVGDANACLEASFTTESIVTIPECTTLSNPLNGANNVDIDTNITWNTVANATGYKLTITSTSGNNNIVNFDNGNTTNYNPALDFEYDDIVNITITPYNTGGDALGCTSESFSIVSETIEMPNCAVMSNPTPGQTNISVDTDINWGSIDGAEGYILNVGTTSTGGEILNNLRFENTRPIFDFENDLPSGTTIYVTITPYIGDVEAENCTTYSFTTRPIPTIPECTNLVAPLNLDIDVPINSNLSWASIADATGYKLSVGTASGDTDILNSEDVGNTTTYNFSNNLDENTTYFITIIPYNASGDAISCSEALFTTESLPKIPACTSLTNPISNSTNISIDTNLSWASIADATGYRLNIGTTSGGTDILNNEDVGNTITYNLPTNLPEASRIYISITPYNAVGDASMCLEEFFNTESLLKIPDCTTLTSPVNGANNVSIDTNITWNSVSNATGYRLNIGTASGNTDILNSEDVGLLTSYSLNNLPAASTIYVSIIPYNTQGDAINCLEASFTIEPEPLIESKYGFSPNGDGINDFWEIKGIENSPVNIVNIYNRWGDLVFTISNYNNQSNVFRGKANRLTKSGAGTLPNGTYFFDIKITGTHNLKKLKGFVVLKR